MKRISLGIIGAGKRSRAHIRFLNRMEEFSIKALADVSEISLAETAATCPEQPLTTDDYRELLAMKEVDAVLIATPNYRHADLAVDALRAGKPVYLEKPMATSLADCDHIISAMEATSVPLMVGLQLRYSVVFRKVKEIIDSGEIGQVRMLWCKEFRQPFHPGWENWRLSAAKSGGSLLEKNCHHFDLFNWFAESRPTKVFGFGAGDVVYKGGEVIDNAWTVVEYDNGVKASLGLCLFQQKHVELDLGIVGDKGIIESYFTKGEVTVCTNDPGNKKVYSVKPQIKMGHGGTEMPALQAFSEIIDKGEVSLSGVKAARESVAVSLAAERAIAEGIAIYI